MLWGSTAILSIAGLRGICGALFGRFWGTLKVGVHVPKSWPNWSFFFNSNGSSVSFVIRILPHTGVTRQGLGHKSGTGELFTLGSKASSVLSSRSVGILTSM